MFSGFHHFFIIQAFYDNSVQSPFDMDLCMNISLSRIEPN